MKPFVVSLYDFVFQILFFVSDSVLLKTQIILFEVHKDLQFLQDPPSNATSAEATAMNHGTVISSKPSFAFSVRKCTLPFPYDFDMHEISVCIKFCC